MSPRLKIVALALVLILPSSLAWIAHVGFDWRPQGHKNYGEMLAPRALVHGAGNWSHGDGQPGAAGFERWAGKWVLLYVGPAACDEACAKSLFYMRQVRTLQDAGRLRMTLVWVVTDGGAVDPRLLSAHPNLWLWRPADARFAAQFPRQTPTSRHLYLIDPMGNLIMRYPDLPDARRMSDDIKLLLKASQIG
ncbi:MAG: SCO family protein [Thiobacillus sp.]